jgi:hypothetical protein
VREQAPIHGLVGISEGGTAASILVTQGASDLEPRFYGRLLISVCALTSPAHNRLYEDGAGSTPSLHLVGDGDTSDIQHMVGRTAGLAGSGSGICVFRGGHKLPNMSPRLVAALEALHDSTIGRSIAHAGYPVQLKRQCSY